MASLSDLAYKPEYWKAGENDDEPCRKKRRLAYHSRQSPISEAIAKKLIGPPRLETWQYILNQLTTSCTLNEEWVHSLYRTLLLHVGYTLSLSSSSNNNTSDDDSHKQPRLLTVLCQCWNRLEGLMKGSACFELEDSMQLLEQILEMYGTDHVDIAMACLQTVHRHVMVGGAPCGTRLLLCILRLLFEQKCTSVATRAMGVLKAASDNSNDDQSARILFTVARLEQTCNEGTIQQTRITEPNTQMNIDSNSFFMIGWQLMTKSDSSTLTSSLRALPKDDMILFTHGLSMSSMAAKRLAGCEPIMEQLHSMSMHERGSLSKDAAICLSSIVRNGGDSKLLVDKLLELLSKASTVAVRREIISAVRGMLQCNSNALTDQQTCLVLEAFSDLIRNELEHENDKPDVWMMDGARIVSFIVTKKLTESHGEAISLKKCVPCLTLVLAKTSDKAIVDGVLDSTLELSSMASLIHDMARECGFLATISHIASNEFTTTSTKCKVVRILWNLAQEKSNLLLLARTKPVLEALIAVASTNVEATAVTNARQYALETLLILSNVVTNRRILAKQVGLLACLIRYTRSMTENDTLLSLPKEQLKDRILSIAVLL